jgi:hypothetical protein
LASKNFELLASLASALKILIPPLISHITMVKKKEERRIEDRSYSLAIYEVWCKLKS